MVESRNYRRKRLVGDKNGDAARSWNLTSFTASLNGFFEIQQPLPVALSEKSIVVSPITSRLAACYRW